MSIIYSFIFTIFAHQFNPPRRHTAGIIETNDMIDIDWMGLIQVIGGIIGGVGLGMFTKSGKIKAQADAYQKMAEAYEYRITADKKALTQSMEREAGYRAEIAVLNDQILDKNIKMREYVADVMQSERDINDINNKLLEAQREIGEWRVACEYMAEWRCEHPTCTDPRGRRPPNGKLCGQMFILPNILQYAREKSKEKYYYLPTNEKNQNSN